MINLKVKDYSVSKEVFTLVENTTYGFLETQPQPKIEDLNSYYKSTDYISHTNSKRNLFEQIYHAVRKITLKQKINLIKRSHKSDTKHVLDIGCGTGYFLKSCMKQGWSVIGIEPNKTARNLANKQTNNKVLDSKDLFSLQPGSFDVITLWHVLEHLPNLEEYLTQLKSLLKPNGLLVVAVPNYKSFDATFYKQFWAAYDVPRHLWHFNISSLYKLTNAFLLNVKTIKPMWFDAFYVSLLSEKYKEGFSSSFRALCVAVYSNFKSLFTKQYSSIIYLINHK